MSKKKQVTKETNQVIDTKDYFKRGWTKPTNPSPAPADIAPLPPQGSGGNNPKPQPGGEIIHPPSRTKAVMRILKGSKPS